MKNKPNLIQKKNITSNINTNISSSSVVGISTDNTSSNKKNQIQNLNNFKTQTKENLISIHNELEYLNLFLKLTFNKQKENTDKLLFERINEINKLREYIFSLTSKLNNIMNISKIENYFNINYAKILSVQPKIINIIENVDDLKANINYGMDRLYLEDNIVCDENSLKISLSSTVNNLEKLNSESQEKFQQIEEIRNNYIIYLKQIEDEKIKIDRLKNMIEIFKKKVLDEKIENIFNFFEKENNLVEEEIFNMKF